MFSAMSARALIGVLLAGAPAVSAHAALPVSADTAHALDLPVVEVSATGDHGSTLAVLLSGDGGWARGDKAIATALARAGMPVVGFDVPSYLAVARTPDEASADLGRLLEHYLQAWRKQRVVLIGYSHGANIAPFLVSRLPGDLRGRIGLLALVSLETNASFQFHVTDMMTEMHHQGDLPVRPELEKLKGLQVICLSGEGDRGSLCPSLPAALARDESLPGGHRVTGPEGGEVGRLILAATAAP